MPQPVVYEYEHCIIDLMAPGLNMCARRYVSDTITYVLNQLQSDWLHTTVFEQCHPDDGERLREQLSVATGADGAAGSASASAAGAGRVLDLKTGTVKKEGHQSVRLCLGMLWDSMLLHARFRFPCASNISVLFS